MFPSLTLAQRVAFPGKAGVFQTLRIMRQFVQAYRVMPDIRALAVNIVSLSTEKDAWGELEALYRWVRANIRYVQDVLDVETLTTPDKTIQMRAGDCDDQSILFATLAESIGYPTRFKITGYRSPDAFEHVYTQVLINGEWISVDPTEPQYFGWEAPGSLSEYVERV